VVGADFTPTTGEDAREASVFATIFLFVGITTGSTTRARGELECTGNIFGDVGSIEDETVDAAQFMHIGGMVGAVERVLDAIVHELVKHIIGPVR
jgi:hypothetical protein